MSEERLFKALNTELTEMAHRELGHAPSDWPLPQEGRPGEWVSSIEGENPRLCREEDLIHHLGPEIYEARGRGEWEEGVLNEIIMQEAQLLCRLATWNERSARLFACDCVERVLPFFGVEYPEDGRLRCSVETGRRYARGEATEAELIAANVAARDAWGVSVSAVLNGNWFRSASSNVGRAAATVSRLSRDAWVTAVVARTHARMAARIAAKAGGKEAYYVADAAECRWQTRCLMGYLYLNGAGEQ